VVLTREPTPADLLEIAVSKGADLDKLERLMDLQLRWEARQAEKAYLDAMADFRSDCPAVVGKDGKVDHDARGGRVKYRHATLGAAVVAVVPHLAKYGLHHSWIPKTHWGAKGCEVEVTCKVSHRLGHTETVTLSGPLDATGNKNVHQQIASSISYLERYSLMAILGLAAEDQGDDAIPTGGDNGGQARSARRDASPPREEDDDLAAAMRDCETDAQLVDYWPDVCRRQGARRAQLTAIFKECRGEIRKRHVTQESPPPAEEPPPPEPEA
jgi:hypothetical protein